MGSSYAMWIPNIGEGDFFYFNHSPSFTTSTSNQISYQSLSDQCAYFNQMIVSGAWDKYEPFYSYSSHKFVCEIVTYGSYTPARYVIRCVDVNQSSNNSYWTDDSNHFIYALRAVDDERALKPIYSLLQTISGYLNTCATRLTSIVSYVDNIESYIDGLEGYVDGIEGYIDGIESLISTTNSRLNTISTNLNTVNTNLASLIGLSDGSNLTFGPVMDSDEVLYPTVTIPLHSAEQLVSDLNLKYIGRSVTCISRNGYSASRVAQYFFLGTSGSTAGYIGVHAPNGANYYLCGPDMSHLITADLSDHNYSTLLNTIITKLDNISVNTSNSSTTAIIAPITGIAGAVNDINADITVLSDLIDTGFTDVTDAISTLSPVTGSEIVPYIDQLEGYTDGIETSLTATNNKLDTIISYLNSNDLIQEPVIISLVDSWGQDLVYSILNAAPVLHLFYYTFDGNILPRFDQSENGIYTLWEKEYDIR